VVNFALAHLRSECLTDDLELPAEAGVDRIRGARLL